VTSALERRELQITRWRGTADHFDDDVDVRILEQSERIGRHGEIAGVTRLAPVAHRCADQPERPPRPRVQALPSICERARDG
jgi:hypothetical protein